MPFKLLTTGALAVATALLLGGCGSSDGNAADGPGTTTQTTATTPSGGASSDRPTTTSSGGGMAGMAMVQIKDFMYAGGKTVQPGEMVMVSNADSESHTLTSDQSGAFTVTVAPGKTASFAAPAKAGSYAFHCDFHSNMHGTLVVS